MIYILVINIRFVYFFIILAYQNYFAFSAEINYQYVQIIWSCVLSEDLFLTDKS